MFNDHVQKVLTFVKDRGNPYFLSTPSKLLNFVTKVSTTEGAASRFLDFYENGKANYEQFRNERYVAKSKKLTDVIKLVKLSDFVPANKTKSKVASKTPSAELLKVVSNCQETIDIARCRGFTVDEIPQHNLLSYSSLFDDDDTTKPDKYIITKELKKCLTEEAAFTKYLDLHTTLVVDFMSLLRRLPLGKMIVFNAAWNNINLVFDSYTEKAIKEGERK